MEREGDDNGQPLPQYRIDVQPQTVQSIIIGMDVFPFH